MEKFVISERPNKKTYQNRTGMDNFLKSVEKESFSYEQECEWWGNIRENEYVEYIGNNYNILRSQEIFEHLLKLDFKSNEKIDILELGCNVGRNLHYIKTNRPMYNVYGNDINKLAIIKAKKIYNLDIFYKDTLSYMREIDNSETRFHCIFTVAHLQHIPHKEVGEIMNLIKKNSDYTILLEHCNDEDSCNGKDYFVRKYTDYFDNILVNEQSKAKSVYKIMVNKNI